MLKNVKLGLVLAAVMTSSVAMAQKYEIDPTHTSVIASWNHFGFSNPSAYFENVTGTITYDPKNLAKSSVQVVVPINTIDTTVPALNVEFTDEAEYFDTAKYPNATFKSTKVTPTGDNTFDVAGKMTIKGVSKDVVFKAKLNGQGEHPMTKKAAIGFDGITTIKRSEFGLAKYIPYVSDEVTIRVTTEAQAK